MFACSLLLTEWDMELWTLSNVIMTDFPTKQPTQGEWLRRRREERVKIGIGVDNESLAHLHLKGCLVSWYAMNFYHANDHWSTPDHHN